MHFIWLTIFGLILFFFQNGFVSSRSRPTRCESIPFTHECHRMPYRETSIPNLLGDQDLQTALIRFSMYRPLLASNCSDHLLLFLCSYYLPLCTRVEKLLPPCRYVCETARDDCAALMNQHRLLWPDELDCNRFRRDPDFCFGNKIDRKSSLETAEANTEILTTTAQSEGDNVVASSHYERNVWTLICRKPSIETNSTKSTHYCHPSCNSNLLPTDQMKMLKIWHFILTVLTLTSASLALMIFAVNRVPFHRNPNHCLIRISFCYWIISLLQLPAHFRWFTAICSSADSDFGGWLSFALTLNFCRLTAMATEYFTLAAIFWWFSLILAYYLEAVFKWTDEAIQQKFQHRSLFIWSTVAIAVLLDTLIPNTMYFDEWNNSCHLSTISFTYFQLIPTTILLMIALVLLCFTLKSFHSIGQYFKSTGVQVNQFERLSTRILCIFLQLFLPNIIQISFHLYIQHLLWSNQTDFISQSLSHFDFTFLIALNLIVIYFPGMTFSLFIVCSKMIAAYFVIVKNVQQRFNHDRSNYQQTTTFFF